MNSIRNREEIQQALGNAFDEVIDFIRGQDDALFEKAKAEGKWTTGQQLKHLIKSVRPINKGLGLPKIVLRLRFGFNDHQERNYDGLVASYHKALEEGGKASEAYIPRPVSVNGKLSLLSMYEQERNKLIKLLNKWDEKKLSSIVAPHPLLSKLTIRELMFFTIYHNYHHLEQIKEIR
jgi:uncharacterized damage-inducible protein DinB